MTLKYQSNLRMMIFARAHDTRGKLIRSQWTKYFKSKDVIWDRFVLTTYSTQSTCVSATKSTVVLPKYAINNYNILTSFQIDMMILNTTLYINLLSNRRRFKFRIWNFILNIWMIHSWWWYWVTFVIFCFGATNKWCCPFA